MLFAYNSDRWYTQANVSGEILRIQEMKCDDSYYRKSGRIRRESRYDYPVSGLKSYKTYTRKIDKSKVGIGERVRAAIVLMCGKRSLGIDSATMKQFVKRIVECVVDLRICPKNPNTHVEFGDKKHRVSMTFGRFIRRKCMTVMERYAPSTTDAHIDYMGKGYQTDPVLPKLHLLTGDDAFLIYKKGEISSCMTGCGAEHIEHHITANPGKLFMVVAYENGKLALRVKLLLNDDDTYFLDRVYWNYNCLYDYQESTLNQAISSTLTRRGMKLVNVYNCTLHHDTGEDMPYMDRADSFDRIDSHRIRLHNDGYYTAKDTDGTDESDKSHRCRCHDCECRVSEDDTREYNGYHYCSSCFDDSFVNDEVTNEYIPSCDSVATVGNVMTHCDNVTRLTNAFYPCYSWELSDDCCEDYAGRTIRTDAANALDYKRYQGEVYHLDDNDVVELRDGDYALESDCIELDDGYVYRDECVTIIDDYGNEVWMHADELPELPEVETVHHVVDN